MGIAIWAARLNIPLDAVEVASDHPDKQVVFFGVGFETTAPANAMAVFQAGLACFLFASGSENVT